MWTGDIRRHEMEELREKFGDSLLRKMLADVVMKCPNDDQINEIQRLHFKRMEELRCDMSVDNVEQILNNMDPSRDRWECTNDEPCGGLIGFNCAKHDKERGEL